MPKPKAKVILADHTLPLEIEKKKMEILSRDPAITTVVVPNGDRNALLAELADARVAIMHRARLDREALEASPHLGLIVKCGIGVDTVDVPAATERGILVVNNPDNGAPEVADHTFALILSLARKICLADRDSRRKAFSKTYDFGYMGTRVEGKVLGLVGLGNIARRVAARARGFGMEVVAWTPRLTPERAAEAGVAAVDLDTLIATSDIVSLHCPLSAASRHMIGAGQLAAMKQGALLVNTGRGPLVDEAALVAALKSGRIAGAALDVLESEPCTPDNPLLAFDNVIITPHMAWASAEAIDDLELVAARQVTQFLNGETPDHVLNKAAQAIRSSAEGVA